MIRLVTAVTLITLGLAGCTFSRTWVNRYRVNRWLAAQNYGAALGVLESDMESDPDGAPALAAARLGARTAHLDAKNYSLAVKFYKHIIIKSSESEERKSAQKFIAQIYFENLQDYDRAVMEYEKLLRQEHRPEEAFRYRLNLVKSHYHLNSLAQALVELEILLQQKLAPEEIYEAKVLRASIFVADKKLTEAAAIWQSILKEFPERSLKENVALNLVVCYEDLKDFGKAIEVLEGMREGYPNPKFLDERIELLKTRMANQPGAQGWRK